MKKFTINASTLLSRLNALINGLDPNYEIDKECGYPETIDVATYRKMFDREGPAARVVEIWPEESWAVDPEIVETEDAEETAFEKAWKDLEKKQNLYSYFQRIDTLSGIGHYGLMLLGINDGKNLDEPVDGVVDETSKHTGSAKRELLYVRTFDQSLCRIASYDQDTKSPRYGKPTSYSIKFSDPSTMEQAEGVGLDLQTHVVHWTRVIHIADNRLSSEVFGTPRMKRVYNRLYDLRKILSSSGEMFWKGGFPGYSIEVNPDLQDVTIDKEAVKAEMESWSAGLQRVLALDGAHAVSMAPQVSDPKGHVDIQLQVIALAIGIPWRVFMGSEEGKLAADQDSSRHNGRVHKRRTKYCSPHILYPTIDRLIAMGVMPEPGDDYSAKWPDPETPSEDDKATVAGKVAEACAKYMSGGVDQLIPPLEFLTEVLGWDIKKAEAVIKAAQERIAKEEEDQRKQEELMRKQVQQQGQLPPGQVPPNQQIPPKGTPFPQPQQKPPVPPQQQQGR